MRKVPPLRAINISPGNGVHVRHPHAQTYEMVTDSTYGSAASTSGSTLQLDPWFYRYMLGLAAACPLVAVEKISPAYNVEAGPRRTLMSHRDGTRQAW